MISSQVKSCIKTFEIGSVLQILGRTTTLHVNLNTPEPQHGGSTVKLSQTGNFLAQVHSCGCMGSVSVCVVIISPQTQDICHCSGSRKEHSLVQSSSRVFSPEANKVSSHSSSIIQDIRSMCELRLASLAFFYCDFREDQKRNRRGILSSLLVQLCQQSDAYYDALSNFYLEHDHGAQPSDTELTQCLKHLLALPGQAAAYIVIDAIDECPKTTGSLSPREEVLRFVEELVSLQLPKMKICVTSRPEADIELFLNSLASHSVSLHTENGQVQDIAEYIKSVVSTDRNMQKWRKEDQELVVEVLTRKAGGM